MTMRSICCILILLLLLGLPAFGDEQIPNATQDKEVGQSYYPPHEERIPDYQFYRKEPISYLEPAVPPEERRNASHQTGQKPGFSPLDTVIFSLGTTILTLVLVASIGLKIGTGFRYESCDRTRQWLIIGHIFSAAIIIASVIIPIVTMTNWENALFSMDALIGVQVYLILSSCMQAYSLKKDRLIPPVHYVHVLFVLIAISMILMIRNPFYPPLPVSVLFISIIYIPGAVLAIITSQTIQRIPTIHDYQLRDLTVTHSLPYTGEDIPATFPERLLKKYKNISIIGSGGVAVVYRAERIADNQIVAVKIPFSLDEISGKTFLNEMAVWRTLDHKNIVRVYDLNIFPVAFVEMECLGRSVRELTSPVSPGKAISIIQDIAAALSYAHTAGIIHRDIKPGNVLLTEDGTAKLTDWGLSRSLTQTGEMRTTSFSLFYASPEQLAPEIYGEGDQRTDIYQLGVLFYELICGEPPYNKQGIAELFGAIQNNRYRLPSEHSPSLRIFDDIISRCLKADPNERFGSMAEFIAEFTKKTEEFSRDN